MHIQTHVMSGWCIGNIFDINARERFFCMFAASLHDIDGLGILFSQELYWNYHHVACHGIFFCFALSFIMSLFSKHKLKCFFLYICLAHLHIMMDLLGSGELWGISYFWPLSEHSAKIPLCWPLYSWQNILTGCILLALTILIIYLKKRSPLEYIMPNLDKKIVAFFRGSDMRA